MPPLVSLVEDQTKYLRALGIKVESIGEDKVANLKIEIGEVSIVYTSPESLLGNGRWINIISSDVYRENLIGIIVDEAHCISHWRVLLLYGQWTLLYLTCHMLFFWVHGK